MSLSAPMRLVRVLCATALAASLAVGAVASTVQAASVEFGKPTAASKFGTGLTFVQPYTSSQTPSEADVVLHW